MHIFYVYFLNMSITDMQLFSIVVGIVGASVMFVVLYVCLVVLSCQGMF